MSDLISHMQKLTNPNKREFVQHLRTSPCEIWRRMGYKTSMYEVNTMCNNLCSNMAISNSFTLTLAQPDGCAGSNFTKYWPLGRMNMHSHCHKGGKAFKFLWKFENICFDPKTKDLLKARTPRYYRYLNINIQISIIKVSAYPV